MAEEEKKEKKAAPQAEGKENGKKSTRKPSALKRDIQSEKRNLNNRSFKSTVKSATLSLHGSLEKKEAKEAILKKLSDLYSLMDKGVKKGMFKQNKADRTKSRLFAKVEGKSKG